MPDNLTDTFEKLPHGKARPGQVLHDDDLRKSDRPGITSQMVYKPNDIKFMERNPGLI
jgi:hypothetical protein